MNDGKLQIAVFEGACPAERVIALDGVLNAETAFRLRDAVSDDKPVDLVIDMTRVRYVDSSGLGVLIGIYASFERACRRLLLAGTNDRVWELFRVCKIEGVFTRYRTVAEAERSLRAEAGIVAG